MLYKNDSLVDHSIVQNRLDMLLQAAFSGSCCVRSLQGLWLVVAGIFCSGAFPTCSAMKA